jgi:hypothetical protein
MDRPHLRLQVRQGPAAVESVNLFHPLFYEGNVDIDSIEDPLKKNAVIGFINNFGQTPKQLFKKPHPPARRWAGLAVASADWKWPCLWPDWLPCRSCLCCRRWLPASIRRPLAPPLVHQLRPAGQRVSPSFGCRFQVAETIDFPDEIDVD